MAPVPGKKTAETFSDRRPPFLLRQTNRISDKCVHFLLFLMLPILTHLMPDEGFKWPAEPMLNANL